MHCHWLRVAALASFCFGAPADTSRIYAHYSIHITDVDTDNGLMELLRVCQNY
jgi:hypothetical protein